MRKLQKVTYNIFWTGDTHKMHVNVRNVQTINGKPISARTHLSIPAHFARENAITLIATFPDL